MVAFGRLNVLSSFKLFTKFDAGMGFGPTTILLRDRHHIFTGCVHPLGIRCHECQVDGHRRPPKDDQPRYTAWAICEIWNRLPGVSTEIEPVRSVLEELRNTPAVSHPVDSIVEAISPPLASPAVSRVQVVRRRRTQPKQRSLSELGQVPPPFPLGVPPPSPVQVPPPSPLSVPPRSPVRALPPSPRRVSRPSPLSIPSTTQLTIPKPEPFFEEEEIFVGSSPIIHVDELDHTELVERIPKRPHVPKMERWSNPRSGLCIGCFWRKCAPTRIIDKSHYRIWVAYQATLYSFFL